MKSKFQELIGEFLTYWLPDEERLVDHRPAWLHGMELDFFFPRLQLAIEVQGRQHYKFTPRFHDDRNDLNQQRWRDREKMRLCHANQVTLLIARTGHGRFACGLEQKIRKVLKIRMKRPTKSMRIRWKIHAGRMRRLAFGSDVIAREWKHSKLLPEVLPRTVNVQKFGH